MTFLLALPMTNVLLTTAAVIGVACFLLWALSLRLRDASIIDVFWGAGFVMTAWTAQFVSEATAPRVQLLSALTTLWGLRLAIYLFWRQRGKEEDHRYAAMRQRSGTAFAWRSLFTIFALQGALMWFVSLPVQIASVRNWQTALTWLDGLGLALWLAGFAFETIGDWQLARFKREQANAGRVMDRGLWRYTRHPNYFGDCCVWWGIYLIAAAGGAALTIASPIVMSALLLKVSGVALLERTIEERRPEYAAYKRRTSAFIPWAPR